MWLSKPVTILRFLLSITLSEIKHVPGDTHSPAENGKSKPGNPPGLSVHWSRDEFIAALEGRIHIGVRGTRTKDVRDEWESTLLLGRMPFKVQFHNRAIITSQWTASY